MALIKVTGNMYEFVTHRWNPVKGKCGYDCRYCYNKRWGLQKPVRLDEKDLRDDLGEGNFIFICTGCDLFHPDVPDDWIYRVAYHARRYQNNKYLLHTKNPGRILELAHNGLSWPGEATVCVTVESNRWYEDDMGNASEPEARLEVLSHIEDRKMITIEPVMDFDVDEFSRQIIKCRPFQVNIGANSWHPKKMNLVEPTAEKLELLIESLRPHTKIHLKKNLRRLLPEHVLYGGEKC